MGEKAFTSLSALLEERAPATHRKVTALASRTNDRRETERPEAAPRSRKWRHFRWGPPSRRETAEAEQRDVVLGSRVLGPGQRPGHGASQRRGPFAASLFALRFQRRVKPREPPLPLSPPVSLPKAVGMATRLCPASRRPPSSWLLGSILFLKASPYRPVTGSRCGRAGLRGQEVEIDIWAVLWKSFKNVPNRSLLSERVSRASRQGAG